MSLKDPLHVIDGENISSGQQLLDASERIQLVVYHFVEQTGREPNGVDFKTADDIADLLY
jgi:hypothetical protein